MHYWKFFEIFRAAVNISEQLLLSFGKYMEAYNPGHVSLDFLSSQISLISRIFLISLNIFENNRNKPKTGRFVDTYGI